MKNHRTNSVIKGFKVTWMKVNLPVLWFSRGGYSENTSTTFKDTWDSWWLYVVVQERTVC